MAEMMWFSLAHAQISLMGSICPIVQGICGNATTLVFGVFAFFTLAKVSAALLPSSTTFNTMPSVLAR